MSLAAGDRLGPYETLAPLGAGGMGEVYRARDTRLKRDVALKVLPATLAGDPERMARFEREAQFLASLNHPNIAAIYGVEERAMAGALSYSELGINFPSSGGEYIYLNHAFHPKFRPRAGAIAPGQRGRCGDSCGRRSRHAQSCLRFVLP